MTIPASLCTEVSAPTNHQRSTLSYRYLVIAAPVRSTINNFTVEWHWHKSISWPHATEHANSSLWQETVFQYKKNQFHSIKASNQMIWQLLGWLPSYCHPQHHPLPTPRLVLQRLNSWDFHRTDNFWKRNVQATSVNESTDDTAALATGVCWARFSSSSTEIPIWATVGVCGRFMAPKGCWLPFPESTTDSTR